MPPKRSAPEHLLAPQTVARIIAAETAAGAPVNTVANAVVAPTPIARLPLVGTVSGRIAAPTANSDVPLAGTAGFAPTVAATEQEPQMTPAIMRRMTSRRDSTETIPPQAWIMPELGYDEPEMPPTYRGSEPSFPILRSAPRVDLPIGNHPPSLLRQNVYGEQMNAWGRPTVGTVSGTGQAPTGTTVAPRAPSPQPRVPLGHSSAALRAGFAQRMAWNPWERS